MRRLFLLAFALLVMPFAFWYDQNFRIRVRHDLIRCDVRSPVTLVHISDLHGMCWGEDHAQLIGLIAAQQPDAVCVTGDMYTRGSASGRRIAETLMINLCSAAPVFFVPGEHDRDAAYLQSLSDAGVIIPGRKAAPLRNDLSFYGCSSAWFAEGSDRSAQYELSGSGCDVLLCHIPAPEHFAAAGFDLMLSGDTHGGIVRLPGIGAISDGRTWLPELRGAGWVHGLYTAGSTRLIVTSGLGGPPIRLGAPPEIRVIHLIPTQ